MFRVILQTSQLKHLLCQYCKKTKRDRGEKMRRVTFEMFVSPLLGAPTGEPTTLTQTAGWCKKKANWMSNGQNCFLFPLGSTETRAGLKTERVVTVRTVKGEKKKKKWSSWCMHAQQLQRNQHPLFTVNCMVAIYKYTELGLLVWAMRKSREVCDWQVCIRVFSHSNLVQSIFTPILLHQDVSFPFST